MKCQDCGADVYESPVTGKIDCKECRKPSHAVIVDPGSPSHFYVCDRKKLDAALKVSIPSDPKQDEIAAKIDENLKPFVEKLKDIVTGMNEARHLTRPKFVGYRIETTPLNAFSEALTAEVDGFMRRSPASRWDAYTLMGLSPLPGPDALEEDEGEPEMATFKFTFANREPLEFRAPFENIDVESHSITFQDKEGNVARIVNDFQTFEVVRDDD